MHRAVKYSIFPIEIPLGNLGTSAQPGRRQCLLLVHRKLPWVVVSLWQMEKKGKKARAIVANIMLQEWLTVAQSTIVIMCHNW